MCCCQANSVTLVIHICHHPTMQLASLWEELKQLTPSRILFNLAVFWVLLRVWPVGGVQEQHVVSGQKRKQCSF